jgi:hypothetical protein
MVANNRAAIATFVAIGGVDVSRACECRSGLFRWQRLAIRCVLPATICEFSVEEKPRRAAGTRK